jgi:hypothetical protein
MKSLNDAVTKFRENWKSHAKWITENRIPRQTVYCQLQGITSHGRPSQNGEAKFEELQQALGPNA